MPHEKQQQQEVKCKVRRATISDGEVAQRATHSSQRLIVWEHMNGPDYGGRYLVPGNPLVRSRSNASDARDGPS